MSSNIDIGFESGSFVSGLPRIPRRICACAFRPATSACVGELVHVVISVQRTHKSRFRVCHRRRKVCRLRLTQQVVQIRHLHIELQMV